LSKAFFSNAKKTALATSLASFNLAHPVERR